MDDLAAKMGFKYSTVTADIDEKEAYRSSDPEDLVMKLAEEKANAILRNWAADNKVPDKGVRASGASFLKPLRSGLNQAVWFLKILLAAA